MSEQSPISTFESFRQTYWTYYLALEDRLLQTERYCAFSQRNTEAFSIEYLTLLLSTCGEVDSLAKAIGTHFFPKADLNNCTISKWGYYLCQSFPEIDTKVLQFKNGMQLKPFDSWQQTTATNKKGQTIYVKAPGSKRLQWWADYNKVKHSRASIDPDRGLANYEKANQGNVIKAIGALFLLNRLMMQRLDADAYQAIKRSKLFKLCNSPDETVTFICYGSKGVPLQITHKAPRARI